MISSRRMSYIAGNCSGNIDVSDPQSCDSVSGECLQCLNDSHGPACSLCAPGFFGKIRSI